MHYCLCIQADMSSSIQAFKYAGFHITMLAGLYVCRCEFLTASRQAVTQSRLQEYTQFSTCSSSPAIPRRNKNIFPKENRKRKKRKRKQTKRTGCSQAKRNRNKSRRVSCEEQARHYAEVFLPDWNSPTYLRFLFIISFDKNINTIGR